MQIKHKIIIAKIGVIVGLITIIISFVLTLIRGDLFATPCFILNYFVLIFVLMPGMFYLSMIEEKKEKARRNPTLDKWFGDENE